MLCLRRFSGEEVLVWDKNGLITRIVVQAILPDGSVKLGFEADSEINIDRLEIYNRKQGEDSHGNR